MINISRAAQNYLKDILFKNSHFSILRIFIKYPGTQYAECKMLYDSKCNFRNGDIEIKYLYFSIYISNILFPYLKSAKIDLLYDEGNYQLMLMAPYAREKIYTVQNNNILLNKLKKFVHNHINPMLFTHGGEIVILEITKSGYVILKFLGSCNGCSMVNTTLKEGIEKKILYHFPDLLGVKDITEHYRGAHSFI
ncbi:NifU family protein [Buchnera aphidicola]|uniref:Fe/S biogenesis protein NfuA n=1 Tax=Buchnera aphidicola (Stegophylla sp.) TaxID=2315800 RepID=A0A4D6YKT1_9GAMM|nr:NifU family protein [Buchnera aphidicola (Stegophylla sp.)]QCI26500.1 Fe-S biogenesis protein NfuA [Buchnera aphidicola (Stegophylla sp.)]